jgi:hypothetical protein
LLNRFRVKLEVLIGVAKLPTKGSSLYGFIKSDIVSKLIIKVCFILFNNYSRTASFFYPCKKN